MILQEIFKRYRWSLRTDRLGPDIPFTHWRLYFPRLQKKICIKKFKLFGDNAEFRPGAYAVGCSKIEIGSRVIIRPGTMLFGESDELETSIKIGNNVMIGCGVQIYLENHRFDNIIIPFIDQGYYPSKTIIIGDGSWIGANSIILPGVEIGKNVVIGAGSIVSRSIPDGKLAFGVPAKVIRNIGER